MEGGVLGFKVKVERGLGLGFEVDDGEWSDRVVRVR
jgi:hypothetical protein